MLAPSTKMFPLGPTSSSRIIRANAAMIDLSDPAPELPPELPPYAGLNLEDILLVRSREEAEQAVATLLAADVVGFDTESKPTFRKGEVSDGPHLIQLATDRRAYLFHLRSGLALEGVKAVLESPRILKVGFGLRDDLARLRAKLGIDVANVLDLAVALRQNKRGDVGAKSAVARFFGQNLRKSKRISTTNWANPNFSEGQLRYAGDDAQVPLRVYRAWLAGGSASAGDAGKGAAVPGSLAGGASASGRGGSG